MTPERPGEAVSYSGGRRDPDPADDTPMIPPLHRALLEAIGKVRWRMTNVNAAIRRRHADEWPTLWRQLDRLLLPSYATQRWYWRAKTVRAAIEHKGRHPEFHDAVKARHEAEWPALWHDLDRLIEAVNEIEKTGGIEQ